MDIATIDVGILAQDVIAVQKLVLAHVRQHAMVVIHVEAVAQELVDQLARPIVVHLAQVAAETIVQLLVVVVVIVVQLALGDAHLRVVDRVLLDVPQVVEQHVREAVAVAVPQPVLMDVQGNVMDLVPDAVDVQELVLLDVVELVRALVDQDVERVQPLVEKTVQEDVVEHAHRDVLQLAALVVFLLVKLVVL